MTHSLKIQPYYFRLVKEGIKTFEIRKDDRNYQVGDFLKLNEVNTNDNKINGNRIVVKVVYIFKGGQFGLEEGYCILGIELI